MKTKSQRNSSDELKDYFTKTDWPRVLFDHDEKPDGGFATYITPKGNIVLWTDQYSEKDFQHLFVRYIFRAFGKPDIRFVPKNKTLSPEKSRIISSYMRSDTVKIARTLGSSVKDIFNILNDKEEFQKIVKHELGEQYSTHPIVLPAGTTIDAVEAAFKQTKHKTDSCVVLRVPDEKIASGGGDGVRFVKHEKDVEKALRSIKKVVRKNILATRVMVERFIPSQISLDTGLFLGEKKIIVMTLAVQILKNSGFVIGTNVLPKELEKYKKDLVDKGNRLAQYAYDHGARGFMDIDWIVGDKVIPMEYNYRESGVTIPEIIALRANGFAEDWGWANWIYILSIHYAKAIPNVSRMLKVLHDTGVLFEGKDKAQGFIKPLVVPLYAMQKKEFDMVIFWRKGSMPDEEAFERTNAILQLLGSRKRVQLPEMV